MKHFKMLMIKSTGYYKIQGKQEAHPENKQKQTWSPTIALLHGCPNASFIQMQSLQVR